MLLLLLPRLLSLLLYRHAHCCQHSSCIGLLLLDLLLCWLWQRLWLWLGTPFKGLELLPQECTPPLRFLSGEMSSNLGCRNSLGSNFTLLLRPLWLTLSLLLLLFMLQL